MTDLKKITCKIIGKKAIIKFSDGVKEIKVNEESTKKLKELVKIYNQNPNLYRLKKVKDFFKNESTEKLEKKVMEEKGKKKLEKKKIKQDSKVLSLLNIIEKQNLTEEDISNLTKLNETINQILKKQEKVIEDKAVSHIITRDGEY
jgi:hypothetical protein